MNSLCVGRDLDLLARPVLAHKQERAQVRDPRRLLHVVRDDHDRDPVLELAHELLDPLRGDRVERRRRLVHEQDLGLDGERPRDAEPLLLAARQGRGVRLQPVLHAVPERRGEERGLRCLLSTDFFRMPLKRSPETTLS